MKTVDFSEIIAVCDMKIGRCRQLIEVMKICGLEGHGHFYLGPRSFTYENYYLFFSEIMGPFLTKFCM